MKRIIIAAVVIVVAVGGYWVLHGRKAAAGGSYRFVPVEKGDVESVISSTGTLQAVETVEVGTQVSGIISKIYADFNDQVKKGQVIARIDTTLLAIAVRDAQAGLDKAQVTLSQARRDLVQADSLYRQELISQNDQKNAQYAVETAETGVESAKIGLERAKRNLAYATIYAPISGTVIERDVDVGQTVAASLSAPRLFLIANDLSKMQMLASVDESDIGQIHDGQTARFTVQAYPTRTFTGTVRQVRLQSTTVDNVVTYTVVVDVANPDRTLLPGMTATVDFVVGDAHDVLTVSNAALRFRPTEEMTAELRKRFEERRAAHGGGDSTAWAARRAARAGAGTGAGTSAGGFASGGTDGSGGMHAGTSRYGASDMATLYYKDDQGQLSVMRVKTGLTNGQVTEISGPRLKEGMQVIAGILTGKVTESTGSNNPFGGGSNNRRRPRFGF
jgi:HlyD family secretion protein